MGADEGLTATMGTGALLLQEYTNEGDAGKSNQPIKINYIFHSCYGIISTVVVNEELLQSYQQPKYLFHCKCRRLFLHLYVILFFFFSVFGEGRRQDATGPFALPVPFLRPHAACIRETT